jgi:hypothetical protein
MRWLVIATLLVPFGAAGAGEKLTGPAIQDLFSGNTVAGTYTHGGLFSEFHAVDGRALGDSGFRINTDACWNIDGDAVCYHYGPREDRRTYCFTVEREGENYRLAVRDTGRLNAIARVLKGNPNEHGDGGRRWSCDDLLAAAPLKRALARR